MRTVLLTAASAHNHLNREAMRIDRLFWGIATLLVTLTGCSSKEEQPSDNDIESFGKYVSGTLPYQMKKIAADNGSKPMLVMYLHGGSSKGNDNETQMKEAAVNIINEYLSDNSIPSIFIVPQCPSQESREQHQRPTSGQCESAL